MKKIILSIFAVSLLSGCASSNKSDFDTNVYFATNQSTLTSEIEDTLKEQAVFLKESTQETVTVEGYTDPTGTQAYNMELGKKRATAVKDYLVSSGVEENRISVKSFGETKANANRDAWKTDRRAVTVVDEK